MVPSARECTILAEERRLDSKLEIVWDGPVPGLADHRISLDAFGKALPQLLSALRRIASNMLAAADEPSGRGRLQKNARLLDIEIDGIAQSSSGLTSVVVLHPPEGETLDLFEDLTVRSVSALLGAIEAEANGEYRDGAVRNYLRSLPEGVTGQKYKFESNGKIIEKSIGSMSLPEIPSALPYLFETNGFITGVSFSPGKPAVSIETEDKKQIKCDAKDDQVETALRLRGREVTAFMIVNGNIRLLNIRAADEDLKPLSAEQKEHNIFGKWDDLLQRLAK